MLTKLHLFKCFLQVRERAVAPDPLERGKSCLLHGVGIVERLDGIGVRSCRHQEVASVDVHQRIFLIANDELLEVMERQVVVTKEVCTLATEDVSFKKGLVKFKCNREVFESFIEDAQASVGPTPCQMELARGFFFLLYCHIEVAQCLVELMHLEV